MENSTDTPTTNLSCSIHRGGYVGEILESFELSIDGDTKEFEVPRVEGLLELADGTVLDVEIIGHAFTVDVNNQWLESNDVEYEYIPSSRTGDRPLKLRLQERGVSFHTGPYRRVPY